MKPVLPSLVGLGLLAAALGSATVEAANRYAVVCIHNRTSTAINFQNKWADVDRWESNTIQPGRSRWFSHRYDHQNENRSPTLLVRFDSDLRQHRYNLTYKLERRAAAGQSCDEGKPYAFEYEPRNRHFIDLKAL
jgi:hypothetical protein